MMIKLREKNNFLFNKINKSITSRDLTGFTRQMATLIEAGIPIIQSFSIILKGLTNNRMINLLQTLKQTVESGSTLADALRQHPTYFNSLFCNLIAAGEQSGSLELMLDKVATYKEKTETLKNKIRSAMAYPLSIILIAIIVSGGLLTYVVPQFQSLFESFGAKIPPLTSFVITLSHWFIQYYILLFFILSGSIYGFIYAQRHSIKFSQKIDGIILKIPMIGPILLNAIIARFTRTLSITFAAGLPLLDALNAVKGVTGNHLYTFGTEDIKKHVARGHTLSHSLENTKLFPSLVVQLVLIGEESGTLEKMLNKLADFYEEAVDNAVNGLSRLLEPLIMALLGLLVGGLIIAMYLPIFKLGSVI